MAKLTGFDKVAVIRMCGVDYHFALYDDDVKENDTVLVSANQRMQVKTVDRVISAEEAAETFKKNITAEVICKVDISTYEQRVEKRKEAERLKKEMDKLIKKLREENEYEMYAERCPELCGLLMRYKELV